MVPSWFYTFMFFALGIIVGYYHAWPWLLIPALLMLAGGLGFSHYRREIFILSVFLFLGFGRGWCQDTSLNPALPDTVAGELRGTVISYPVFDGEQSRFVLERDKRSTPALCYVLVSCNFKAEIHKGDQLILKGVLKKPAEPGNPGEFHYPLYLAKKHITYIMTIPEEARLQIIETAHGIQRFLNLYRSRAAGIINKSLPGEEGDILRGMLMGDKEEIDDNNYQQFQKAGIVHIFAVSGLHLGFLIFFCHYLGQMLGLSRKTELFTILLIVVLYGSMIGWPLSIQRAALMASLALLAQYLGRQGGMGNSLGLAGILILLLDPLALFTVGFQLSFLAAWGLVYLYPLLKQALHVQNPIISLLLIPLCAQIAVLPLIAWYFNLITPLGILENILITYLAGAIVILGFMALLLAVPIPALASLFLYPAGLLIQILIGLSGFMNSLPGAYLWVKTPSPELIGIYVGGLLLAVAALQVRTNWGLLMSGLVLMMVFCVIVCLPASLYQRGVMELTFLDVGQGDSILIKTPSGRFILLDGGGSMFYDVGRSRVLPYLHHRGIRKLYMVINTHPDADHLQGLLEVMEEISPKYIGIPANLREKVEYEPLRTAARTREIPVIPLAAGMRLELDEKLSLQVLYPPAEDAGGSYNHQSLVLSGQFQEFSMLLPGDLDRDGLEQLLETVPLTTTTIVKVPHHGSRYSLLSEFYQETDPYWAVISAGRGNSFGHPHLEVMEMLEKQGISIYRTDQDGMIRFCSDGYTVKAERFRKED